MKYLASFAFIFFLYPICLAERCTVIESLSGEISDSTRAVYTKIKCWNIKVPEDSYLKLKIFYQCFEGMNCLQGSLKVKIRKEDFTYEICSQYMNRESITSFGEVTITYRYNIKDYDAYDAYNYYFSSFRITYSTESLVCLENDHFQCAPNTCIHRYEFCNHVKDCENGADEALCGIAAVHGIDESRESAVIWLQKQRLSSFGWGKNTHRAITALFLSKAANFTGKNLEEDLMVKQLELQTSVALLRNSTDSISISELSMFVNALRITCHNPRKFYGHDLLQVLGDRASVAESPSPSAFLTLCNSNWTFTESDIEGVFKFLQPSSKYPFISDVEAVAVMAVSCMNKRELFVKSPDKNSSYEETIKKFIASQLPDGSFGNVYTTALVTQALISSGQEDNKQWNLTATINYLMKQLNSTSVDFLSTYLILPILSGRSLVDISAVNCSNITRRQGDNDISDITNKLGGKMRIQYSLYVGDRKDLIHTIILKMPENSTAYDVMRVAKVADPKYKFLQRDVSGQMYVYDIAGITNDAEAGMFWLMYLQDRNEREALKHYTESPDKLVLGDDEHLIMWYRTANL